MYVINIKVKENREVFLDKINAGNNSENGETILEFNIPKEYSDYNKYLDIYSEDRDKTQTVVSISDEERFRFTIPYELTLSCSLIMQLVLKKGDNVFKSNTFCVSFGEGLNVTGFFESSYKDTINYLMENKLNKSELLRINEDIDNKLDRSAYYSNLENIYGLIDRKADNEITEEISERLNNIYTKDEVDSILEGFIEDRIIKLSTVGAVTEINLSSNERIYKCNLSHSSNYIQVFTNANSGITPSINYKFELIMEINNEGAGTIPSVTWQFYHHPFSQSALKWISPPSIQYVRSINKFSFETFDGGATWFAKQCYGFEKN